MEACDKDKHEPTKRDSDLTVGLFTKQDSALMTGLCDEENGVEGLVRQHEFWHSGLNAAAVTPANGKVTEGPRKLGL